MIKETEWTQVKRYPMFMGESTIKISILTKAMYIHAIAANISMTFFTETKAIFTSVWSLKGTRRAKGTLRKQNRLVACLSLTSV